MADRMYPIKESELAELQEFKKWFEYLANRLDYAQLNLSFGGRSKIYHEQKSTESLIEQLKEAVGFEEYSDEDEDDVDSKTTD